MHLAVRLIVGMSVCAVALLASSWWLKDNPAGEWVDAFLYLATWCFFASQVVVEEPQSPIPQRADDKGH